MMEDEVFLTTEEVLTYLKVNLRTIYRLIKAGKIPAVRVGRQWRFRKTDIDAWLNSQRPGAEPAPPAAKQTRPRILVVDDEDAMRSLLTKALSLADYDVDVVADGQAALDRLRVMSYDLLITDLKLPGIDGLTVVREVKQLKVHIPVIIITGHSSEANAIAAANLGVSGYLTKPFELRHFLTAADKSLGQ